MQVEHHITVKALPETIFRIYEDVNNWHTWDPDTRQAKRLNSGLPVTLGKLKLLAQSRSAS